MGALVPSQISMGMAVGGGKAREKPPAGALLQADDRALRVLALGAPTTATCPTQQLRT